MSTVQFRPWARQLAHTIDHWGSYAARVRVGVCTVLGLVACHRAPEPAPATVTVTVVVSEPGAAAVAVEHDLTLVVEEALSNAGATSIRSESRPGVAVVSAWRRDRALELADVRARVEEMTSRLPSNASMPEVIRGDVARFDLTFAIDGTGSRADTADVAQAIAYRIERQPGIAAAEVHGGERVIEVRVDPVRLASYGVTTLDVDAALSSPRADVPVGTVPMLGRPHDLAELGSVVIRVADGVPVRISDVATIASVLGRGSSEPVSLAIRYQGDADRARLGEAIADVLRDARRTYPTVTATPVLSVSRPVIVDVRGADREALAHAADAIALGVPGCHRAAAAPELVLQPDRDRLARLGVDPSKLARFLAVTLGGTPVARVRSGDRDDEVRIVAGGPNDLTRLVIRDRDGRSIPVSELTTTTSQHDAIRLRIDRQPAIAVTCEGAAHAIRDGVRGIAMPAGAVVVIEP